MLDVMKKAHDLGAALNWDKWMKEIPYIEFPKNYLVRAVPPFNGAVVRYNIRHKKIKDSHVSIYLDCYDVLGCYGAPYWEIYPHQGDVFRCDMEDTSLLLLAIEQSFKDQKKERK